MIVVKTLWTIVHGSKILQIVLLSAGVMVAVVTWLEVHDSKQQAIGAKNVVTAINTKTEIQVDAAIEDSKAAKEPGSADRLRAGWCRDCR